MTTNNQVTQHNSENDELSLKELLVAVKTNINFLKGKWLVISCLSLLGGGIFFTYAHFQKIIYTATLSFVLQDESPQSSGGGLSGIASQFGLDIGGTSNGAFSQANIIELIRSRELIETTLLTTCNISGKKQTLADLYIDSLDLRKKIIHDDKFRSISFLENQNRDGMPFNQRLLLISIYRSILGNLAINLKDKKGSILVIEYKCVNEMFAKVFTEMLASRVSEFYITTKSAKAKNNVDILQRQADSLKSMLNAHLFGVARINENTFNMNPSLSLLRVPSIKGQLDVQIGSALLTQVLGSLEMAKIALRKETPLFFIIDKPVFPLSKTKPSSIIYFVFGGALVGFIVSFILLIRKSVQKLN